MGVGPSVERSESARRTEPDLGEATPLDDLSDGDRGEASEDPYIAIVTITKDDPIGIRKTVASVECQDFSHYHHVIVNGGSSPDVAHWLETWRRADPPRRSLIGDTPPGIYPAMNAGIRAATAPLVLVLNGGDELRPGALEAAAEHHRTHRWRWAYGGIEGREADGRLVGRHTFSPFSRRIFRAGIDVVPHQSAYVTRELYQEIGLYREDLGTAADQEFFLRASVMSSPGLIPGVLATFHRGGVSGNEGVLTRELTWHRLRMASETGFGGIRATDLAATVVLVARQVLVIVARRIRRAIAARRGPRGRGDGHAPRAS